MSHCTLPSTRDMTLEYLTYKAQAHEAKTLRPGAMQVIRTFRKEAQARDKTVWGRLSTYQDPDIPGLNGAKIKRALRLFLIDRQGARCCYCRRWLMNNAYASPIEHILPRSTYPQFAVQFWNMALSCYHCNELKKKDVWGAFDEQMPHYPQPPAILNFFHPRYHRYDEHVRFFRVESNYGYFSSFTGITVQGQHLCARLLCKIAGKESLCHSTPAVADFLAMVESFQRESESPQHLELDSFRAKLEQALLERLNDGAGADTD